MNSLILFSLFVAAAMTTPLNNKISGNITSRMNSRPEVNYLLDTGHGLTRQRKPGLINLAQQTVAALSNLQLYYTVEKWKAILCFLNSTTCTTTTTAPTPTTSPTTTATTPTTSPTTTASTPTTSPTTTASTPTTSPTTTATTPTTSPSTTASTPTTSPTTTASTPTTSPSTTASTPTTSPTTTASTPTTSPTTTASTTISPAPAVQCGKGASFTPTSRSWINERILGSSAVNAKKNIWTFMVAINRNGAFFCSGTLLSDTKVLSAAQCFEKLSLNEMSTLTVVVGNYLADQSDAQMTRRISKVAMHSKYNSATFANDIAIVTLDTPVDFSKTIGPVCLPPPDADPDQYADQNAVILGWDKAVTPVTSDVLQQALVSISYNSDCKTETNFGRYVTDSTSCVTSTTAFTCVNDVGGPVLINSSPNIQVTTAVWTIVGINSFTSNDGCLSGGLKTRVSAFIPWINTYMI